jgi:hypothetical protein
MSELDRQFHEDRALRDAARRNLLADVAHLRANLSGEGIAKRVLGRLGDGAVDVLESAKEQAEDKRGVLAALIGALFIWLAREPILETLGLARNNDTDPATSGVADDQTRSADHPHGEDHTPGEDYHD